MKNCFKPQMSQIEADWKTEGHFEFIIDSKNHLRTSAPSAVQNLMGGHHE